MGLESLPAEALEALERMVSEEKARRVAQASAPRRRSVRLPVDPGPVDDLARARARAALARAGVPLRRAR